MAKYVVKKNNVIYDNSQRVFPNRLSDNTFKGAIPVGVGGKISEVTLYFATYLKLFEGTLRVTLIAEGIEYSYVVNSVKDNMPLSFKLGKSVSTTKPIFLYLNVELKTPISFAIWANERGICAKVSGPNTERIDIKSNPLISVVMPVYNCEVSLLRKSIMSVIKQQYKNWQLCIVDDGSRNAATKKYLESLSKYGNIFINYSKKNQGISAATNKAMKMATGDYVCFLDNGDTLERTALLEVAQVIDKNPAVDLVYTDEDKILEDDTCFDPFYKPDYNYTMLLSQNYICHLAAYRRKIVEKLRGFSGLLDGAQDYDFLLRFIEKAKEIHHIPKVLYHWRTTEGSTAMGIGNKPGARFCGELAIASHLTRIGAFGSVSAGEFPGTYRVNLSNLRKRELSIIIPFKDKVEYLNRLLSTLRRSTFKGDYKIYLVDNGSSEEELSKLEDRSNCHLLKRDAPFNYSALNNYAVKRSESSELLLFLNNDMEVMDTDFLDQMAQHFFHEDVAAVGAKLLYPNYKIQHAGVVIGIGGVAGHSHKYMDNSQPGYFSRPHLIQEVTAVTGACLMVRRSDFRLVNGFDENLPEAFNDVDFCLKLREKGRKIVYTPYARMLHYESLSRGLDNYNDKGFANAVAYMQDKWNCLGYNDPFYNANLSLEREDYSYQVG